MSVLDAINNPITLNLFADADVEGHGILELDDGLTTSDKYTTMHFDFKAGDLSYRVESGDYVPEGKMISSLVFYGYPSQNPLDVYNNISQDFVAQSDIIYDATKESVTITGLDFNIADLLSTESQSLLSVTTNATIQIAQ